MIRKVKVLGIAFAAVFAMTAVAASAAQAEGFGVTGPEVGSTVKTTSHSTTSNNKFTVPGLAAVECSTHHFESHTSSFAESTTLTVTPTYKNCKAFGFLSATVTTTGCKYVFHTTSATNAIVDVSCEAGKSIEIVTLGCTVKVGSQTGLGNTELVNVAGETQVELVPNVTGISYTKTGTCGAGSGSNGSYTGNAVAAATDASEEPVPIMVGEI